MARACTVTAIYRDGSRHALTVEAATLYRAVLAFNSRACTEPALGIPRPEMDTQFEVRLEDGRVLRTDWGRVMRWANRQAERRAKQKDSRL